MIWTLKKGDGTSRNSGGPLSFIGTEMNITGNINATGDMHIEGSINGDLSCATLILGQSGRVKGNVIAQKAMLAGTVDGSVNVGTLMVERSARLSGDLSYENISIETGAKVDSRLSRRGSANELKLVKAINE